MIRWNKDLILILPIAILIYANLWDVPSFNSLRGAAQDSVPITPLTVAGAFWISADTTQRLQSVQSTPEGLWFLLANRSYAEAVETTASGVLQKRILLTSNVIDPTTDFCLSSSGNVATLHRGKLLEIHDDSGQISNAVQLGVGTFGCLAIDDRLIAADSDQVVDVSKGEPREIARFAKPLQWPNLMFDLPNHHVGVIEMGEAILSVLDTSTGKLTRRQIYAPEIQQITRAPRTETQVVPIVFAAATNASGDIYLAIGPFSVSQGAIILEIDEYGTLKRRFRCALPKSSDLITDRIKDGHFVVSQIALTDGKLFLISKPQRRVIYFLLNRN